MVYSVKEIYPTLQGEGAHTGRRAVFCRFAGCNLWSGLEKDRSTAVCDFCDTDFVGTDGPNGGKFNTPQELANKLHAVWQEDIDGDGFGYIVFTGGEPLLQLDDPLIKACHELGMKIGAETNGTLKAPKNIDWLCVSPKSDAPLIQTYGNELKLVYPQDKAPPEKFASLSFEHYYLQPMDGPNAEENTERAAHYCLAHPQWKLSLQTHKLIGLP